MHSMYRDVDGSLSGEVGVVLGAFIGGRKWPEDQGSLVEDDGGVCVHLPEWNAYRWV